MIDRNDDIVRATYVYDNEGATLDRYTVLFGIARRNPNRILRFCLGLSSNPDHPQGFSQWCEAEAGNHLGRLIDYDDLPLNVRSHIAQRLA